MWGAGDKQSGRDRDFDAKPQSEKSHGPNHGTYLRGEAAIGILEGSQLLSKNLDVDGIDGRGAG
jgi:hypothetical protein